MARTLTNKYAAAAQLQYPTAVHPPRNAAACLRELKPLEINLGEREVQPEEVMYSYRRVRDKLTACVKNETPFYQTVNLAPQVEPTITQALPQVRRPDVGVLHTFRIGELLADAPLSQAFYSTKSHRGRSPRPLRSPHHQRADQLGISPRLHNGGRLGTGAAGWSRQEDGKLILPWKVCDDKSFTTNYKGFESREMRVLRDQIRVTHQPKPFKPGG